MKYSGILNAHLNMYLGDRHCVYVGVAAILFVFSTLFIYLNKYLSCLLRNSNNDDESITGCFSN